MKPKEKVRDGRRVSKTFGALQTPEARLLASAEVTDTDKARLR
jgi:hypothetical protein